MLKFSAERSNWDDLKTKLIWLPHKKTYEFASKFCKKKIVLDAGCGAGWGSNLLSNNAIEVVGIDIDRNALKFARTNFRKKNIKFNVLNMENISNVNKKFDVIVSFQTIEHLKNPKLFLKQVKILLNNKGLFLLSTPNRLSDHIPSPYHYYEYSYEEIYKILIKYFRKVSLYGLSESKKIKSLLNQRRKYNNLLFKIDKYNLRRFIPLPILSIIFSFGSSFVGLIIKNSMGERFRAIKSSDYEIIKGRITDSSDIIAICN